MMYLSYHNCNYRAAAMEALKASSSPFSSRSTSPPLIPTTQFYKPFSFFPVTKLPQTHSFPTFKFHANLPPKFNLFITANNLSTVHSTDLEQQREETVDDGEEEKFDWFSEWYPVMPVCDLDKRAPHGKKVIGLDVVVWWDRIDNAWKVFEDSCPHRLAPLSQGRIDQWGRLQCVYHGWCFGGSGDCKFIPQAPRDGPPIHTSKKACVAVYPSTVQNDIIWFWPNTDPQYKDIITKKKPPYIPELDDPTYTKSMGNRDIPYGYEVLTESLMDPSHVPYAHYGILPTRQPKDSVKADREGGRPLNITIEKLDRNGFTAKNDFGGFIFVPPCLFYGFITMGGDSTKEDRPRRSLLIFVCVPVSPGHSRLIFSFPRNFAVWIDRLLPRWMFHIGQNLILDSDLYLLHLEERKIMEVGPSNWQKACFVPTKSDALVVSYRRWLKKYGGGQMDWGPDYSGTLPPTPPREQLLDRYWSHVVNCSSCSAAYKALNAVEVTLQVLSVGLIGIVVLIKQQAAFKRNSLVMMAVLCFAGSRWLSHFIYKNFHFHDYNHAFK